MTEFKPNPFKIAWEELIVKKIAKKVDKEFNLFDLDIAERVTGYIITLYNQETAKQKGLKE